MALVLHWYDAGCFAIVAVAVLSSLWLVTGAERRRASDGVLPDRGETEYESLLLPVVHSRRGGGWCLWTSCWLGLHPGFLLLLRLVSAVVLIGLLSWDVGMYDYDIFVYYTEWTCALTIVYFGLGALVSGHGCWNHGRVESSSNGPRVERSRWVKMDLEGINAGKSSGFLSSRQLVYDQGAAFLGRAMQMVYQTCAGAVILTDVVFWCLIVPFLNISRFSVNPVMCCMHSLNLVFLLLDTALNNLPLPALGMAHFVLWSSVYVIFQWVLHACGMSWWPYPFLELSTPWASLWYLVMALFHIPCYGFYFLVVKAKNYFFPALFPNAFTDYSC